MVEMVKKQDDEIRLVDIIQFVKDGWKIIGAAIILGAVGAYGIAVLMPPKYEASVLIEMGQVTSTDGRVNSVELPALVIERLRQPSAYSGEIAAKCGLLDNPDAKEKLAAIVSAKAPKSLTNVVDISIRRPTQEVAKSCAEALFAMVHAQQDLLAQPFDADLKSKLGKMRKDLQDTKEFMAKMESTGLYQTVYLSYRDNLVKLSDEIARLESGLLRSHDAKLVSPVSVTSRPVEPRKPLFLFIGLAIGGIVGVMAVWGRKALLKVK
ncbi:Wzz/FepE/Etk N-terminal domain-containing protein [Herbaspirillum sp. VT-16-41]|uniref:Wzz/FepE/Etk N-terminal domain-containing protein n=1 Tax=Herbaspirillum sp. VT-16-41 TaxID=1953765 RepID=UPI000981C1A3|nr:Wzz/FepE/Etk N-terminal domain-containing protein [Herbaspirillum sp. VT-16-41]ONN67084.1 hypothetical protein BTM36_06965 [Herbaspirillum sp. VT-16-41]